MDDEQRETERDDVPPVPPVPPAEPWETPAEGTPPAPDAGFPPPSGSTPPPPPAGAYPPPGPAYPPHAGGAGYPPPPGPGAYPPPGAGYGPPPPGYGPPPGANYPHPGSGYPAGPPPGWAPPTPGPPIGMAVTALVLACLGASFAWIPFLGAFGLLLAVVGIVLGLVARRRAVRGTAGGLRMAFWAVIAGAVGVLLGAGGLLLSYLIVESDTSSTPSSPTSFGGSTQDIPLGHETTDYDRDQLEAATPAVVGEPVELGDVLWTVTSVDTDATDALAEARSFPQEPRGQFVLVAAEVENPGTEPVDLTHDLQDVLVGSDDRTYYGGCSVDPDRALYRLETLGPGESAEVHLCFDIAPEGVPGARLLVSRYSERWEPGAVWTLDQAG